MDRHFESPSPFARKLSARRLRAVTGAEIKAARDELGMTLASFAFWLGLEGESGRRRIRRWENGQEPITGPAARAIQLALALRHACDEIEDTAFAWTPETLAEIDSALGFSSEPAPSHSIRVRS